MKNKSRPAVARKLVEPTSSKNVMIVETRDGPLEIDLSDMPELEEITEMMEHSQYRELRLAHEANRL